MKNHSLKLKNIQIRSIRQILLILGIVFVAFNLRPAITAVGPLIDSIRADVGISSGVAGLITTLPLIAFAIMSPIAPKIGHRLGIERAIFVGMMVLIAGILIRSMSWTVGLFVGTGLIGLGIAISNVLLPGLVKGRFPSKMGLITSMYSTSMGISAAIASGISVPLAHSLGMGWQNALLFWAALAFVTLILWSPQVLNRNDRPKGPKVNLSNHSLWKSTIAWQVTLYMGLQSLLFYCMIAWLPAILHSQGMSMTTAGWMLSIMQFTGLSGTLVAPFLAHRFIDQKGIVVAIASLFFIGFTGLLMGGHPFFMVLSVIMIGIAQGAGISLALMLFALRSKTATQAARLSGMAQSIGYLLAATGPFFIGFIYDHTQSWTIPLLLLLMVTLLMGIMGYGAGRNQTIS